MLRKRIFCLGLLFCFFIKPYAQVNLQTGSATFSLPLFNWQDDKSRLNSMVALSYSSGNGLKVNDVASCTGQGWNLVAGGSVTRMQVGEPDDQMAYNGNGSETDIRRYPAGYLYATIPAYNGCPDALTKYPIYQQRNQVYKERNTVTEDKQMDYFAFQFNGKAGMFVLDKVNGDYGISLGDTKMKISFQRDPTMANGTSTGIRTTIKSFTIQDVDGLIYKFAQLGVSKVLELNYCDASLTQRLTQPKFNSNKVYNQAGFTNSQYVNPYVVNSWCLTEVEDALTHRKIFYNYIVRSINTIAGEDISFNWERNYALVSHKTAVSNTPDLTSIVYPDGHNVTLTYNTTERVDFKGEYALSSVDVSYQGRYLSKHLLNTIYFVLNRYGTPTSDYQKKVARLCLRSVQKIGVDLKEDTPPYLFDYYMGSDASDDYVPPPFSYAKDIWGYYNGNNSKGYNNEAIDITTPASWANASQLKGLCFLRPGGTAVFLNPKPGYAKNGLLRQVIYPTGGTLTYQYDQNTGVMNGASVSSNVGGVHVSQTSSTDGGYSNGCSNPITTNYNYVLAGGGNASSLWAIEMPVNVATSYNHYEPELKKWKPAFPFGTCYFKYQYPGILSLNQSVDLSYIQRLMVTLTPYLNVLSAISTIIDVVHLFYSGGPMAIVAVVLDVVAGLVTLVLTCFNNPSSDRTSNIFYNVDMNGISPLPTQFKRVEVIENPGTIGKTVHEFTSSDDYSIWGNTNPNFAAKQRFAAWAYGLPKLITAFDANGNKVKQTVNFYDFSNARKIVNYCWDQHPGIPCNTSGLFTSLVSCKCQVSKSSSQRNVNWGNPSWYNDPNTYQLTSNGDMKVEFYGMYSGRTLLDSTVERVFRTGDPTKYVETATKYYYNSNYNYEVRTIVTWLSNGNQSNKDIKYSSDYTGGALTTLVQNNIVSLPVATVTSSSAGYLNESVTEFSQLANGDIKPSRIIEQRFDKPQNNLVSYAGPGSNTSAYKVPQTFVYDASGNLIGLKDEGDRTVTNIYDYLDKYIVASVINADPSTDKAAYSSFESTGFGNWSLSGSGAVYVNGGITGARSFVLNGNTLTRSLNTAKPYTLSFWANNSNVMVTGGATLAKSAPTISGLTYYEYNIAQGTATVSVSGNANIDELRVYPQMARMRTVTYDPAIGKTSECDENNRITYYEYDNLGRLRFIKDEKSNIVKMYEYNNVSAAKQNGCPVTYYNRLITEQFTKNNCGHGSVGTVVPYSIPANTYSSTVNQFIADFQAEYMLMLSGQSNANTFGSCQMIFSNDPLTINVISETCGEGYVGGTVTYTVPAGRYTSLISLADANQQAQDDADANAQAYANDPAHAVCTVDASPDWEWDNIHSYCLSVNGNLPPHLFVFETDVNPNSGTYTQTRWTDVGPDDACPAGNYYNAQQSATFTRNNCGSGLVGTSMAYIVPPGKYSSTVSQAAANQLAINDINANGQDWVNSHTGCVAACTSYQVTVPNSVGNNLYIAITRCGQSPTVVNWNTILLDPGNDPGSTSATFCLTSLPSFRYGANGSTVTIPEITITTLGSCQ